MEKFSAFRIFGEENALYSAYSLIGMDDLSEGDVVVETTYSNMQYKDALAATGKGKVVRKFPINGGTDAAGVVRSSSDPRFKEGDRVAVLTNGMGETHDGGYSQFVRVPADWVSPIPDGMDDWTAMAIGSTGLTAALALHRLEQSGLTPDSGKIVVTGATGGVGSIAIGLMSKLGYEITAVSGKSNADPYLKDLGAKEIVSRSIFAENDGMLGKGIWAGGVDNIGGQALDWMLRTSKRNAAIASVGNASGAALETNVYPFILRAVSLLGVNAAHLEPDLRQQLWERLASDLRPWFIEDISTTIEFSDLPNAFERIINGKVLGRIVVKMC